MLVKTTTDGGERYWIVTVGTVVVEHLPYVFFGSVFAFTLGSGRAPAIASVCFAPLVLASLWHSVQVVRHGIEFRDDVMIVHGLMADVIIFRDELRVARCWYDRYMGVRFEFEPTHELAAGKPRSTRTTVGLPFASMSSRKDIRRLAVLIQRWWQAEPPPPGVAAASRQVIPLVWGNTREDALRWDRRWSVLYDVIDEGLAASHRSGGGQADRTHDDPPTPASAPVAGGAPSDRIHAATSAGLAVTRSSTPLGSGLAASSAREHQV